MTSANDGPASQLREDQQIDVIMRIADFYIARHDGRREFEWKVTLGIWGALLGSIFVLRDAEVEVPLVFLLILALAILLAHGYWLYSVWRAHRFDKDTAFELVRGVARDQGVEPKPFVRKDILWMPPSMAFQLLVTVIILTLVALFFSGSLDPRNESGVIMELPFETVGVDWVKVFEQFLAIVFTLAVAVIGILLTYKLQQKRDTKKAEKEDRRRQRFDQRLAGLGVARGNAIDVRADGRRRGPLSGQALTDWVQAAERAEREVIDRGNEVAEALGSLVNWYDTVSDRPYTGFPGQQRQMLWNLSGVARRAEQVILTSYRR